MTNHLKRGRYAAPWLDDMASSRANLCANDTVAGVISSRAVVTNQHQEEEEEEEETAPASTSAKTRGKRIKKIVKKNVEPQPQAEEVKDQKLWSQDEELLLAECFIQIFEDPKVDTHKWKNPDSRNARRNCHRVTKDEPELFGPDELLRPPDKERIAKSQRSSNSTASSGSNPTMFQEMMQQEYELDWNEKMERINRETNARVVLYDSQKVAEDLKVLQMSTDMDPVDAAVINAQKTRIRALYAPQN
ncbi:hypothetical protein Tco_0691730 [Tanacetum coccineum]